MKKYILLVLFIASSGLFLSSCKNENAVKNEDKVEDRLVLQPGQILPLTNVETAKYKEKGQEIVQATFKTLSSKLKAALNEGGVKEAAQYCNLVALPITDSLSTLHKVKIKRTSLQLRNPENKPSKDELEVMERYKISSENKLEFNPLVRHMDNNVVKYYAPIKTMPLCLTCHGTVGEELTKENYEMLAELYPEDKAIGYKDGDLRGIWSIEMERE